MDKKRTGERLKANDKRQKTENKSKEEEKEKQSFWYTYTGPSDPAMARA